VGINGIPKDDEGRRERGVIFASRHDTQSISLAEHQIVAYLFESWATPNVFSLFPGEFPFLLDEGDCEELGSVEALTKNCGLLDNAIH
jgi:hypothetical protein